MKFLVVTLLLISCSRSIKDNDLIIGTGVLSNVNIKADTGTPPYPALRYNSVSSKWESSNDGTTYSEIGGGGAGSCLIKDVFPAEAALSLMTARVTPTTNVWYSVAYGNGLFVAVSQSGTGNRVMTSPDGTTWTIRTSPQDNQWNSVVYGNGLFVAVASTGTNRVMTSPDGITWTLRNAAAANNWWSVTYGNGLFVAVAQSGSTNRVMTSPDGINWTSRTSPDGINWTQRTQPVTTANNSVAYGNGLFVAVGPSKLITSPDGINWTSRTVTANSWTSVTYGNGAFAAVSQSGTGNRLVISTNGIEWNTRTSTSDSAWYSITFGNGMFVAVSNNSSNRAVMSTPVVIYE